MTPSKYMQPRDNAQENMGIIQRMKAAKLHPVMVQDYGPSEGGVLNLEVNLELEPIVGRMLTNIAAEFYMVYVPYRALDALKNPDHDLPGNDEALRERIIAGETIFALEGETPISKEVAVNPTMVDGAAYVCERTRLAYIAANNYLRRRLYHKATQLDATVTTIQPALLSSTVLQRFNAVLNPEDRVNGAVNFEGQIPVDGLGVNEAETPAAGTTYAEYTDGGNHAGNHYRTSAGNEIKLRAILENGDWRPDVYADLGQSGADISLLDFFNARRVDGLTREMASLVEAYPQYGEQIIARFAHGLKMDMGKQPVLLHQRKLEFTNNTVRGMDGPSLDTVQTQNFLSYPMTVPVPKNEFGGIVIAMVSIKPDETNGDQPHPRLATEYKKIDYHKDELLVHEPQRVTVRDLNAEAVQVDEGTLVFYNGNNRLKKRYNHYGFSRNLTQLQIDQIADRHTLWRHEIPMSVTPDNIVYPETLTQSPFAITDGDVATCHVVKRSIAATPLIFGEIPVEELAAIEDANIFGDLAE